MLLQQGWCHVSSSEHSPRNFTSPVQEDKGLGAEVDAEVDADGSEVDVEEEEDDIIFETDPETGEVINLDGESVIDDDEEEEEEDEEEGSEEPVLGEADVSPALEMPAIKAGLKDAFVDTAGGAVEQQPVEVSQSTPKCPPNISPTLLVGHHSVDGLNAPFTNSVNPSICQASTLNFPSINGNYLLHP